MLVLTSLSGCARCSFAKIWSGQRWRSTQRGLSSLRRNKQIGLNGYLLLAVPVSTFILGTWQVRRRKWKLDLIDSLDTRTRAVPLDLLENLDNLDDMEYRRFSVKGTFDHSKEFYLGPRSFISQGGAAPEGGQIVSSGKNIGFNIITPFHVSDTDLVILVNRGWVPRNKQNPETRKEGQVSGEVSIIAVLRKKEKRAQFVSESRPEINLWHYRDPLMAELVGAVPIFLDADEHSTVEGGPIGGQTRVTLRNEHLSYIFTWYTLCAITGFWWYRRYILRVIG